MAGKIELTILMPCLNEAETIARCVEKAKSYLKRSKIVGEVLVADNGSTDGSIKLAEAKGACVVRIRSAAARGRYVIMGDADDAEEGRPGPWRDYRGGRPCRPRPVALDLDSGGFRAAALSAGAAGSYAIVDGNRGGLSARLHRVPLGHD